MGFKSSLARFSKMKKKHLLFVCTEARQRSPTAVNIINAFPVYKEKYEAKAAGLSPLAAIHITEHAVKWADIIIVMNEQEDRHKTMLLQRFPSLINAKKPIYDFDIRDVYLRNEPELKELIKRKLREYLR